MKLKILATSLTIATLAICAAIDFRLEWTIPDSPSVAISKKDPLANAQSFYAHKQAKRKDGISKNIAPEQHARIERERRTPDDLASPGYAPGYQLAQLKYHSNKQREKNDDLEFIERGPGNVAGRTRAILVIPTDISKKTWIAGSASGGIWKTTNGGQNWINKTPELPNLGTNTLAMSNSDPSVIYAGTGEHFTTDIDGAGLFKSSDGGESWDQIVDPNDYDAFRNISRIIVDPDNSDIVVATARNSVWGDSLLAGIYKSIDGGASWDLKLLSAQDRYDDLIYNPLNFNTQYVAINRKGILKSTDGGENWFEAGSGLKPTGRVEICISPVDTNRLYASVEGNESGTGSDLYLSSDAGVSWQLSVESQSDDVNFLGGQGWYDNFITAHPYERDVVYFGGINIWKTNILARSVLKTSIDIEDYGAFDFLDFINGTSIGGGILEGNVPKSQVVSVELRFGQGTQKAHRFSVNGRGAGVPAGDYMYQDLVDLPFQVWDVTNDRQLMASFRDQQDDGEWSLISRSLSANTSTDSREYIFIHLVEYADTVNTQIAIDGGHEHEQLYFMWPVLRAGSSFDPQNQDPRSFGIVKSQVRGQEKQTTIISDAYQQFSGVNNFSPSNFENNLGVHPDQHNLVIIRNNQREKIFSLLSTNDGGVFISEPGLDPGVADGSFSNAGFGFNTTQFYSADKEPGRDRYIGGMQDNSTWLTPRGESATASTSYDFAFGGDGFEALWNNRDPDLILATSQFNSIRKSSNGGRDWTSATNGINDAGPFISRLNNSRFRPDRVFTVGSTGIWISDDFGGSWRATPILDNWSFNNSADIEVSHANPDIVWAGGRLNENQRLFVSTDGGQSFSPSNNYEGEELGFVSGIGTHPFEDSTAYALFSFANRPKVLRTMDLGQTWVDISGYVSGSGESDRGFPDVAVNCLLVLPNDTARIWVGTEIGIVESLDNGLTWSLMDTELKAANVWDFKIQDDQVVVATYGRGIWSVQMEGLEREYIFAPAIKDVAVAPNGNINIRSLYSTVFDSSQIVITDERILTNGPNALGDIFYTLDDFNGPEGEYEIQIIGFKDGERFESGAIEVFLFTPNPAVTEYFNDLSIDSLKDDFYGFGFSVRQESGFDDPAIHSLHTYLNQRNHIYNLKTPFLIADDQSFSYQDVAIIETGEANSSFGSADFYDFVVVEASNDGLTWIPVAEGYDASANPTWLQTYNSEGIGTSNMFVNHIVDLADNFDIGEEVFLRFRLSADPAVVGWGWAIDDLNLSIESTTTPTLEIERSEVILWPNPVASMAYIAIPPDLTDRHLSIYNINGHRIFSNKIPDHVTEWQMDFDNVSSGIYMITLQTKEGIGTFTIFKE